jgi:hypothetical protein
MRTMMRGADLLTLTDDDPEKREMSGTARPYIGHRDRVGLTTGAHSRPPTTAPAAVECSAWLGRFNVGSACRQPSYICSSLIGAGAVGSPRIPKRSRDENIGPRAGRCGANRRKPVSRTMSSYTASIPPRMK